MPVFQVSIQFLFYTIASRKPILFALRHFSAVFTNAQKLRPERSAQKQQHRQFSNCSRSLDKNFNLLCIHHFT
jgi:hypothetical protein